jgi:hypothetical protein
MEKRQYFITDSLLKKCNTKREFLTFEAGTLCSHETYFYTSLYARHKQRIHKMRIFVKYIPRYGPKVRGFKPGR